MTLALRKKLPAENAVERVDALEWVHIAQELDDYGYALLGELLAPAAYLRLCHGAGQSRPTPLLLRFGPGDFNCLHQDLYGQHVFPIQITILLSKPGEDFTGGEFVLVEQRPRMQSRAEVVALGKGNAVAFAVHQRPVQGKRGYYRANFRHGVSRLRSGNRYTLGIIFHDAK